MTETIQIPDFLAYPKIGNLSNIKELVGQFCYVFKHYPQEGRQLLIIREKGQVCVRLADWAGKEQDPTDGTPINNTVLGYSRLIVNFMGVAGIPKAIYYFSQQKDQPLLVDMRLSQYRFCGPGYVGDFIGKLGVPIQERVGDPVILKPSVIESIIKKEGIYTNAEYIVKTSKFKPILRGEEVLPLYGIINNETKIPT